MGHTLWSWKDIFPIICICPNSAIVSTDAPDWRLCPGAVSKPYIDTVHHCGDGSDIRSGHRFVGKVSVELEPRCDL